MSIGNELLFPSNSLVILFPSRARATNRQVPAIFIITKKQPGAARSLEDSIIEFSFSFKPRSGERCTCSYYTTLAMSHSVDWSTLPYYFISSTTNTTLTTSYQNILSLTIDEGGVYYVSAYAGVSRTSGADQADFQYQVTGGSSTLYSIFTMYAGGGFPSAHCTGIVTISAGTTIHFQARTTNSRISARIEYLHNLAAIKIAEA